MREDGRQVAGEAGALGGRLHALRLEPAGVTLDVRAGESVLEAAARAAWHMPSSCRNGTCRACLCRLLTGELVYRVEWPGLSVQEKQDGWMLACVALPVSDVVVEQVAASPAPASAVRRPARGF
ncbi:2Fe-2S iron-sulfur cluster-binding protein [Robbsia sp. Bb-Pol-6]|uniref:2Fe-2S iron-sulfur cluster-binding protein n=1 Tax=Robbsia betulipollinis TaxID=2981849 RepID=A0ABT3ZSD1_9BURK|nr:2Fe-2S iron-sulfur cluster-binding protein [Robbsia betulipollinis]MCY0389456.1 2Fe-2S iron-sulfur cluster-binding protein [Robbsia betulipollinis]